MLNSNILIENHTTVKIGGLVWQVRRGINCLAPNSLIGISKIILRDTPLHNDSKTELEQTIFGYYIPTDVRPIASIELYISPIYHDIPKFLWWSTVPTILIVRTLAHEIGHHLHLGRRTFGSLSEGDEIVANRYASKVLENLKGRWSYKLGFWWIQELAFWHFSQGILDSRKEKHRSALAHFYSAWNLNPQLEDVAAYFWAAKEKAGMSVRLDT